MLNYFQFPRNKRKDCAGCRKKKYVPKAPTCRRRWVSCRTIWTEKRPQFHSFDTFCKKRDRPCYIFLTFKGKKQQKPHSEKDCSGCSELWAILIALGSQAQVQKWNIQCPGSQCRTSGSETRVDCRDGIPHRLSWSEQKMLKTNPSCASDLRPAWGH